MNIDIDIDIADILESEILLNIDIGKVDIDPALLQMLHWLPVHQRIAYKLCVLMQGVTFGYASTYLQHAVVPLSTLPGRAHLRSADTGQYDTPGVSSSAGSRAFSVAGPN